MNKEILNIDIQDFINNNLNSKIHDILLKGTPFERVETKDIVAQIESKKRSKNKLPSWYNTEKIYYPNKLNIEQTSSEITAEYKAGLVSGKTLIDITGGLGVDSYYFSKKFDEVIHCELNDGLSEIAAHNFQQLRANNIITVPKDGLEYLMTSNKTFDWIYIDPSRRHDVKGKVFFLSDCLPNVPKHLDMLFNRSSNILIKTSPLLDISAGINELNYVKAVHIVAVNNEVKELLWILEKGFSGSLKAYTINIKKDDFESFDFNLEEEKSAEANYSLPLTYIYEPNAAILKSGGFNEVSNQLNLSKLHPHSHLYTSDTLIDFPGRSFKIKQVLPYGKKEFKKLEIYKANITTRNFPESVEQIRKKFKINDGGDIYLFFTTDLRGEKILLICQKNG